MSSTTLVLAVAGGVFCGASLVGTIMLTFLWWQSNQRSSTLESTLRYQPLVDPMNQTLQPQVSPDYPQSQPSVPSPIPTATPPPAAGVRSGSVWLDGVGGMVAGQRIMIHNEETLLGRSGVCNVQFHDPKVSRQHALLRLHNNEYYLQDMQSTGGTYVNGRRVTAQVLHDHDQVRLGDSVVIFRRQ